MKRILGLIIGETGPALLIAAGAVVGVVFVSEQRDAGGSEPFAGVQPIAAAATAGDAVVGGVQPAATITKQPSVPESTPEVITPCSKVVLPEEGVGEADFVLDVAAGTLGIHFGDVRNGRYRNVSYTVEYLDDPTCSSCPEVARLIDRVDPPGWPDTGER